MPLNYMGLHFRHRKIGFTRSAIPVLGGLPFKLQEYSFIISYPKTFSVAK